MSGGAAPAPFDLRAPLPRGTTVLEASAGTGKTYTIAALAARYVAEGMPIERLLVVTFTRAATGELRERIRERLVGAERALDGHLRGLPLASGDELATLLADADRDEVVRRRDRLLTAIGDFDAATIDTTHGFCQEALGSLGFAGELDRETSFVEDLGTLPRDVVDDLYVRRFWRREPDGDGPPPLSHDEAMQVAGKAIDDPAVEIVPDGRGDDRPAMRARLARRARTEVAERKRVSGLMTFDDLLLRLDSALSGERGATVIARMRERYDVALIDEFQDTDPIQWRIVEALFGGPDRTLILIGDPKQAIYRFRGADVYTYLAAARGADAVHALAVNWRSDQALLDAYDALFGQARLGHPEIVHQRVQAAPSGVDRRLRAADGDALPALRVRIVDRSLPTFQRARSGLPTAPTVRPHIATDVALDIARMLGAAPQIRDAASGGWRPLAPADVAVLVRKNREAETIHDELLAAGVPAVLAGAGSVFATDAATAWLRLLEAIERPAATSRAGAAAIGPLIGRSAGELASALAGDGGDERLHTLLHDWGRVLRERGVASLFDAIATETRLAERLLGVSGGERTMTDLTHVAELLHDAAITDRLEVAALVAWLRAEIDDAGADAVERARRLESDAQAVQVLTIHRSKGLEFPVVYCPTLWEGLWMPKMPATISYHDTSAGDRRLLDVSGRGAADRGYGLHVAEERGEELRLAYVALTRARHQAVLWWAGVTTSDSGPLTRLAFGQGPDGSVPDHCSFPDDESVHTRFGEIAALAPAGTIAVERSGTLPPPARRAPAPQTGATLAAACWDRALDDDWRRTSYSDITAASHATMPDAATGVAVVSETEAGDVADEPDDESPTGDGAAAAPSTGEPLPLAALPGGRRAGSLVHDVVERIDFTDPRLPAAISVELDERGPRWGIALDPAVRDEVAAGLAAAIATPIGGPLGGLRLADVAPGDRLDELGFELPLAAGGGTGTRLTAAAIARVLDATTTDAAGGEPIRRYVDRLADPGLRSGLHGYLTGSIDLVARVRGPGGRHGYVIVDYKTNRLGPRERPPSDEDYAPARVADAMLDSHYVLQALLYTAALHRFLRWRDPGYDPAQDILGVAYLFVRGMRGPATPADDAGRRHGTFSWRPPAALVTGLSDLLDRGVSER